MAYLIKNFILNSSIKSEIFLAASSSLSESFFSRNSIFLNFLCNAHIFSVLFTILLLRLNIDCYFRPIKVVLQHAVFISYSCGIYELCVCVCIDDIVNNIICRIVRRPLSPPQGKISKISGKSLECTNGLAIVSQLLYCHNIINGHYK